MEARGALPRLYSSCHPRRLIHLLRSDLRQSVPSRVDHLSERLVARHHVIRCSEILPDRGFHTQGRWNRLAFCITWRELPKAGFAERASWKYDLAIWHKHSPSSPGQRFTEAERVQDASSASSIFRHDPDLQIRLRYSPGLAPTTRLNALLNAASDS